MKCHDILISSLGYDMNTKYILELQQLNGSTCAMSTFKFHKVV